MRTPVLGTLLVVCLGGATGCAASTVPDPRDAARVYADAAEHGDADRIYELCETLQLGSLCAHGGAIPDPIRTLLVHFEAEMTSGGVQ